MNSFKTDKNNQEVLLSKNSHQVMMEWEKPYMEACIDALNPKGDVLEIGFGCGYSATQIMKFAPKSYTVVECDPIVIEKAKVWAEEWAKKYPDMAIMIKEGTWQSVLPTLSIFDEIFFDDFPIEINDDSSDMDRAISSKRFSVFLAICIQSHTKIGSKISMYVNGIIDPILGSDSAPFVELSTTCMDIFIPSTCKYRDVKHQKCLIPLIKIIKNYSFEESQQYAISEILKNQSKNERKI